MYKHAEVAEHAQGSPMIQSASFSTACGSTGGDVCGDASKDRSLLECIEKDSPRKILDSLELQVCCKLPWRLDNYIF